MKKFILCTFTLIVLAACSASEAVRGNLVQDYQLKDVKVGTDTQSDILQKLGSPTTKAPFDDNVWYYLGQKTEKHGILDPKVVEERVVQVQFDANGIVKAVNQGAPERLDIPYDRDKTPTSGNEMNAMQQLLGNMGRFNKMQGANTPRGSGEGTNIPGR